MGKRGRATVAVFPPALARRTRSHRAGLGLLGSPEVSIDVIVTEHQAPAGSPAKGSG